MKKNKKKPESRSWAASPVGRKLLAAFAQSEVSRRLLEAKCPVVFTREDRRPSSMKKATLEFRHGAHLGYTYGETAFKLREYRKRGKREKRLKLSPQKTEAAKKLATVLETISVSMFGRELYALGECGLPSFEPVLDTVSGFQHGLQCSIAAHKGAPVGETQRWKVLQVLSQHRREIGKLLSQGATMDEHAAFIQQQIGKPAVGFKERVRKIYNELGLKTGTRGRPRRKSEI